jgi:hypothetical protein
MLSESDAENIMFAIGYARYEGRLDDTEAARLTEAIERIKGTRPAVFVDGPDEAARIAAVNPRIPSDPALRIQWELGYDSAVLAILDGTAPSARPEDKP